MGNVSSKTQQSQQTLLQDEQDEKYAYTCEICLKPVTVAGNNNVKNSNTICSDCLIKYEEQKTATFTCEICFEPMTIAAQRFKNSNLCVHPFCTECMIKYIEVEVEDKVSDIKCPYTSCKYTLEPLSCRSIITDQLFVKWCNVLCESAVLGVDRVYCPNRECMELILNECGDRKMKKRVCPNCKKPFCFGCRVPWHDGYSCQDSKKMTRDENDIAFDVVYKTNKWQMCPKCRHCVERVYGCNRITCRCGTSFCYKCGKQVCKHAHWTIYLAMFLGLFYIILVVYFIYRDDNTK